MSAFATYPTLGLVAAAGPMNAAMVTRATGFNATSDAFSISPEAALAIPGGRSGETFARAVYGLQAFLFDTCLVPAPEGGSAEAGARCSNIDGMLGPNTMTLVRGLPVGIAGSPGGQSVVSSLILYSEGNPEAFDDLSVEDMSTAVRELGLRAAAAAPGPVPPSNGETDFVKPPPGAKWPGLHKKPKEAGMNMWIVLGAAALGIGVLWYATKGKRR